MESVRDNISWNDLVIEFDKATEAFEKCIKAFENAGKSFQEMIDYVALFNRSS